MSAGTVLQPISRSDLGTTEIMHLVNRTLGLVATWLDERGSDGCPWYITKPLDRAELELSERALRQRLGSAIRGRRQALGLTLADLAKRGKVSVGYLSQVELGRNSVSLETLYRIALALRVRIADLFQAVQVRPG